MLCETAREHLSALSDGERLNDRRQVVLTRQHCMTCRACRTYRRQLRQISQTARRLPMPLPAGLRGRVLSQLPPANALTPQTYTSAHTLNARRRELAMFKRLTAITGAVLVAAVAATLTAQTTRPQTAIQTDQAAQPTQDKNEAKTKKHNYAVTDIILRGIEKRDTAAKEDNFSAVSSMSASPLGANGWNKQLGISWKVQGHVTVDVITPGQSKGQVSSGKLTDAMRRQLPPDALPPRVPRVEITISGKTHTEQGYGRHDITNNAGKLLMRLDVKPVSDAQ